MVYLHTPVSPHSFRTLPEIEHENVSSDSVKKAVDCHSVIRTLIINFGLKAEEYSGKK